MPAVKAERLRIKASRRERRQQRIQERLNAARQHAVQAGQLAMPEPEHANGVATTEEPVMVENRGGTPATAALARSYRRQPKLNADQEREMLALYADRSFPIPEIIRTYGISESTMHRIREKHGQPARPRGGQKKEGPVASTAASQGPRKQLPEGWEDELIKLYNDVTINAEDLRRAFHFSTKDFTPWLKSRGVVLRARRPGFNPRFTSRHPGRFVVGSDGMPHWVRRADEERNEALANNGHTAPEQLPPAQPEPQSGPSAKEWIDAATQRLVADAGVESIRQIKRGPGRKPMVELTPQQELAIVTEYQRGDKLKDITARYNIADQRIYWLLRRHGVPAKRHFGNPGVASPTNGLTVQSHQALAPVAAHVFERAWTVEYQVTRREVIAATSVEQLLQRLNAAEGQDVEIISISRSGG